ncbi:hypothetical protein GCM10007350_27790 [Jeongeupia chitinilytica]|uniref:Uncharacterized protein n=1 Tax=Jeongeupia chitinilytica TaxID=1041641 RepID=A0ABQ3H3T5_9NEIS|nr:hypothetical protein GCM10007350_27790 [Jeongeupia chitinilytica]
MPSGSVQTVLVCAPSAFAQAPCPAGQAVTVQQVYLLDPSQKAAFEAATADFDYGYAAGVWSLAFCTVVGLYLATHGIGLVLGFIRRG